MEIYCFESGLKREFADCKNFNKNDDVISFTWFELFHKVSQSKNKSNLICYLNIESYLNFDTIKEIKKT